SENLHLYGLVVGALTGSRQIKFQIKFENIGDGNLVVDILAGNLRHEKRATLSSEVAEQSTIHNEVAEQSTNHTELLEFSKSSSEEEDYASDASNVSKVDLTTTSIWKEQPITIDQRAIHLTYKQLCQINLPSVSLASPFTIFSRYLPMNYIEQNIIRSINLLGRKNTQPLMPFNFQRWMTLLRFEQIVSQHTLIMPHELEITSHNDPLFLVRSFTNAFNTNLIEAIIPGSVLCIDESMNSWLGIKNKIPGLCKIPRKPHPVGQEWKFLLMLVWLSKTLHIIYGNGLYGIFHVKKRHAWPINYPDDMVEKLNSTYGSYISKVATLNNIRLIAASLQDRKPQCIIATASTTVNANKVKHVVKRNTSSEVVEFTRLK
ncbi:4270_t:CDS:2, partial [Gigaspora margarita]